MVAMDLARAASQQSKTHPWSVLTGETAGWKLTLGEMIEPGRAEGETMGGCLSLLVNHAGDAL